MIKLKIATPKRIVFDDNCQSVTIPGECGEMKILEGHAPLISNLKIGIVSFGHNKIAIEKGFAEINQEKVTILSEGALFPSEINENIEKKNIENVIKKLNKTDKNDSHTINKLNDELDKAETRLKLMSKD